jgi:putative membrane protein
VRLLINAIALWVATRLLPEGITYGNWRDLLLVALVFGVLNAVVRPILKLLTWPLQILTLGLFTLVLNGLMLLITGAVASFLGLAFQVVGLGDAVLAALIVSLVSVALSVFVRDDRR